jgi:hypothetical protein
VRGTHAAVGLGSTDLSSACMSTTVAVVRFPAFPSVLQTGSKLPKPDQSLHLCPRAMSPCSFRSSAIQYSRSMLISMMKRDAVGWKLVHTAHDELRADGVELIPDARACSCTHYCHSQHRDKFICAIDNSDHCTVDTTNNAEWTCTVLSCSTCRSVNRSYIGWRIDVQRNNIDRRCVADRWRGRRRRRGRNSRNQRCESRQAETGEDASRDDHHGVHHPKLEGQVPSSIKRMVHRHSEYSIRILSDVDILGSLSYACIRRLWPITPFHPSHPILSGILAMRTQIRCYKLSMSCHVHLSYQKKIGCCKIAPHYNCDL